VTWNPNIPAALLLLAMMIGLFVPDIVQGIRAHRAGRAFAKQITQEHEARRFLENDWKTRHDV
jgi:hypothetical protein